LIIGIAMLEETTRAVVDRQFEIQPNPTLGCNHDEPGRHKNERPETEQKETVRSRSVPIHRAF
jgi:hypothetical protein